MSSTRPKRKCTEGSRILSSTYDSDEDDDTDYKEEKTTFSIKSDTSGSDDKPLNSSKKKRKRNPPMGTPGYVVQRFNCDKCPGKFFSEFEFNRHKDVHDNPTRKLISCVVCRRVFNKRDSLNSHIAAHENAEERQLKLDLMNCWPTDFKPRKNNAVRARQFCRYCLIIITKQSDFVEHMKSEHEGGLEKFPCHNEKCSEVFVTVGELVKHSKSEHPKSFYGKLSWNRMTNGIFTGKVDYKTEKSGQNQEPKLEKPKPKRKSKSLKGKRKRNKKQYDEDEDDEWLDESESYTQKVTGNEIKVKVEQVDLDFSESIQNQEILGTDDVFNQVNTYGFKNEPEEYNGENKSKEEKSFGKNFLQGENVKDPVSIEIKIEPE